MIATGTPGVIANIDRKNGAVRDARRMRGLESAAELIGGQEALAEAIGTSPRNLRKKIVAERPIYDADVRLAAQAVAARARAAHDLAGRLLALVGERGDTL